MSTESDGRGVSRRDLLKRGAVVGVAAAWTVPLVQVVSMTPAHADTPSAAPGLQHTDPGGVSVGSVSTTTAGGEVPTSTTPLASTGTDLPVGETIGIGTAAVALGAGAVAAAHLLNKRRGLSD